MPRQTNQLVRILSEAEIKSRLAPNELEAIRKYTLSLFCDIKSYTEYMYNVNKNCLYSSQKYNGTPIETSAKALDSGIKKLPPSSGRLYRTIRLFKEDLDFLVTHWQDQTSIGFGKNGVKNWTSTSHSLNGTFIFAGCTQRNGIYRVTYVIDQVCGRSIQNVAEIPEEQEILISPASSFVIQEVRMIKHGSDIDRVMVHLKEVDANKSEMKSCPW